MVGSPEASRGEGGTGPALTPDGIRPGGYLPGAAAFRRLAASSANFRWASE